jgi:pilus assembly protein Flp/PilA
MSANLKRFGLSALALHTDGQDLIEYALMAGFVAVAVGAVIPNVINDISTISSKVGSVLIWAGTSGS